MRELPQLWIRTTIGEIVEPFDTIDPTSEPNRDFRYVDIGSIDNAAQEVTDPKSFQGQDAPSRARRLIRKGDVLFSTVRTYLKNIAIVSAELDGALTSTGIAVMRPGDAIESRYLFNWVRSDEFVSSMSHSQDGSLYPAVTDRDVNAGSIPLAPIAEQRRIVAKLDELLGRTTRARKELDRVPTLVARYKQAILASAFSGDATRHWREKRSLPPPRSGHLAELVAIPVRNGLSIRGSDQPPGVRALRLSALRSHVVDLTDVRFLPIDEQRASRYALEDGDVLVSRGNGTKAFVGLASLVMAPGQPTIFPDTAFRIRLEKRQALATWFTSIWNAPQTREQIESSAKTTAGIWKVSQGDLTQIRLLVPSIEEQEEIVRRVESAFAWLDKLAAEHARACALLPKLEQALLAKAFRGELVPQDPNDEPASVLLERIRAARAAVPERKHKARSPQLPRAPRLRAAMTKSRLDQDVMHQPYLAKHLRDAGGSAKVEDLFRSADLPVTDFYKQLAWEVEAGHVNDQGALLEAA